MSSQGSVVKFEAYYFAYHIPPPFRRLDLLCYHIESRQILEIFKKHCFFWLFLWIFWPLFSRKSGGFSLNCCRNTKIFNQRLNFWKMWACCESCPFGTKTKVNFYQTPQFSKMGPIHRKQPVPWKPKFWGWNGHFSFLKGSGGKFNLGG